MTKPPVFVITDPSYDSYTDYWRLVRASNFDTCLQSELDPNRNCSYIISPSTGTIEEILSHQPPDHTCAFIVWFLERPGPLGTTEFKANIAGRFPKHRLNQVWFADRAMYNLVKDLAGTKFVPVGSDVAIGTIASVPFKYDLTHMSYVHGRRAFINNLPYRIGPNGWGEARHQTLMASKFMLNVHQDWDNFSEPLRFALCAAYGLPLITEECTDPYPYENGRDLIMVPYTQLPATIHQILEMDYSQARLMGLKMFETATQKFRFKTNVEAALV